MYKKRTYKKKELIHQKQLVMGRSVTGCLVMGRKVYWVVSYGNRSLK